MIVHLFCDIMMHHVMIGYGLTKKGNKKGFGMPFSEITDILIVMLFHEVYTICLDYIFSYKCAYHTLFITVGVYGTKSFLMFKVLWCSERKRQIENAVKFTIIIYGRNGQGQNPNFHNSNLAFLL